jgi:hypothetical protein
MKNTRRLDAEAVDAEREAGHRGQRDRADHRGDRDGEGVQEVAAEGRVLEHGRIVLERDAGGHAEVVALREVGPGADRGERHAESGRSQRKSAMGSATW